MSAFEIITLAATAIGVGVSATSYFRPKNVLSELGHTGAVWFDHEEDHDISQLPADDAVEEPIRFRPLRARMR